MPNGHVPDRIRKFGQHNLRWRIIKVRHQERVSGIETVTVRVIGALVLDSHLEVRTGCYTKTSPGTGMSFKVQGVSQGLTLDSYSLDVQGVPHNWAYNS